MVFLLSLSTVSAEIADLDNSLHLNDDSILNDYNHDIDFDSLQNSNNHDLSLNDNLNEDDINHNLDEDGIRNALNDNKNNLGSNIENTGGDSLEKSLNDDLDVNLDDKYYLSSVENNDNCGNVNTNENFCSLINNENYGGVDNNENNVNLDSDDKKNTTILILTPNNSKVNRESDYSVKLLDNDNNPILGGLIFFKINSPDGDYTSDTAYTNSEGIATVHLSLTMKGIYNIQVSYYGDWEYEASNASSNLIISEQSYFYIPVKYAYRSSSFLIQLFSQSGEILSNQLVQIYLDGVRYDLVTDSKGQVSLKMPSDRNLLKLLCVFSGSDAYEGCQLSMDLPVYIKTYTKALVYSILKGKSFSVLLKGADGKVLKNVKVKITINGKTYTRTTNSKGIAYLKISLKRNQYKISFSFDHNSDYGPSSNSSTLNVIDPSGQYKKGLNQKKKGAIKKYLTGGGRAKITAAIRKQAKKIANQYSTKLEKAVAIFNFVRDNLAYSYYANSRRGAHKTLKDKRGNCCDHANLIIALCRAVNIPARYSHAQGCRFSSGLREGHVWAQIYVGGKWYSADGTSYRNSLGHIANWNTKSYYNFKSYRRIPF